VPHLPSYLPIVGPDVGRMVVAARLSVVHYHGNMVALGVLQGLIDGICLVGSRYNEVNSPTDELVDLLYLALIGVICRGEMQRYAVISISSGTQFLIKLVAPNVFRALRNAYLKPLRVISTRQQQPREYPKEQISRFCFHVIVIEVLKNGSPRAIHGSDKSKHFDLFLQIKMAFLSKKGLKTALFPLYESSALTV